ncbi:hypothetical protein GCK72_006549 [Caenorhabditis remanei]|uniref:Lipoprotein n=1 Tax=Caenorhabditis remanei TaxID=31234 RepID=A0A6A5HHM5_CAERE|nr:hypothetical protein GCK72_006549 [Caenorhabditis remanei]KAF1766591.1 hypothetical protein GCK72_006549 [Caenorhabditis remanei]
MFLRLLLLAAFVPVVYLWCTPFIACNQTIYGDFSDAEKGLKVLLLGRPFQKMDELIISGEYYNNGSEVMDDASFTVGLSKGLIMHQLGEDLEQYLLTTTLVASEARMNVSGSITGKTKNLFGVMSKLKPNVTCDEPFTFKIKSIDGYGFSFGNAENFSDKQQYQYAKKDRAQSVFFDGQIKTTKIRL